MDNKTDIQEINEAEFEEKVLTESSSALILVDFGDQPLFVFILCN